MLFLATELKKNNQSLQHSVTAALRQYLEDLDGEAPDNLYETVMGEIEKPLLTIIMEHCENNQSRAASCLGINRGTLRKKLQQYQIKH
jgi:Fis family transcriptional regulator